ncbi:hypothetical protein HF086_011375 [Spodoptera exigua]|uniref:Uncharacterized protein n=1 Tax=Spodoptera exigua TaxID=7107 RepID=A0A922MLU8_SPOEX|nr:hypothetical protein HF086_011375 [Spodoptera exigua]
MKVGGTCAKVHSCPPGTKVWQKGLCPEQQRFGMECCRPRKKEVAVRRRTTGRPRTPVKWTINKDDNANNWKQKPKPKALRTKSKVVDE